MFSEYRQERRGSVPRSLFLHFHEAARPWLAAVVTLALVLAVSATAASRTSTRRRGPGASLAAADLVALKQRCGAVEPLEESLQLVRRYAFSDRRSGAGQILAFEENRLFIYALADMSGGRDSEGAGGVILSGDHGPIFSHSYYTLTARQLFSDGRDRLRTNLPPRSVGTSASPLMKMLDGSHYDARLTQHEQDMVRYWIESAAPYPGTYAALGTGMIGGFPKSVLETSDRKWPNSIAAAEAIRRRCTGCHDNSLPMPKYLSDNLDLVLSNPDFNDIRVRFSRHFMFNLSRPAKSLILLAPMSTEAGGYGLCRQREKDGRLGEAVTVFADTNDQDYQKILAMCRDGKRRLEQIKRFDMPGFRPTPGYVREMKRYGILPNDLPEGALIDVYATDRAYWRSLWWQPTMTASSESPP